VGEGQGALAATYITGWGQGALLVSGSPTISTVTGIDNTSGYNYDPASNTSATSNTLNGPRGIGTDLNGNIYIADEGNKTIREITLPERSAPWPVSKRKTRQRRYEKLDWLI
jgi:hypothetical protein